MLPISNPIQLPPLQNSWFDDYNPVKGKLTKESDRANIQRLLDDIAPRMKRVIAGYEGERNGAGKMHGRGVYRYADGGEYKGEYKHDKMHGRGVSRYANGSVYEGEYKHDKMHGRGVYRYGDGNMYEGEYKGDKMHGRGVYRFVNGDEYEGEFNDGKMHGQGVYRYANGNRYEGEFMDDSMNGRGVLIYANGYILNYGRGQWNDDESDHIGFCCTLM